MKKARSTMALALAIGWFWIRTHGLGPAAPYAPDYCILIVWMLLALGTKDAKPKASVPRGFGSPKASARERRAMRRFQAKLQSAKPLPDGTPWGPEDDAHEHEHRGGACG